MILYRIIQQYRYVLRPSPIYPAPIPHISCAQEGGRNRAEPKPSQSPEKQSRRTSVPLFPRSLYRTKTPEREKKTKNHFEKSVCRRVPLFIIYLLLRALKTCSKKRAGFFDKGLIEDKL